MWRGTEGREPGRIGGGRGTGGAREARGERAGSEIPQVEGTGRKGPEKILQYCVTFYNRTRTKGAGTPMKGDGKRE